MRLIITRHGETEESMAGIIQGHLPGKLSADGIEQAKKVAFRLKDETLEDLYLRAESFLHKIILKHHQDTVLLVGHNGINKALIAVITGKKHKEIQSIDNQHNTSVNIFEIDESKNHKLLCFNCIKHLITTCFP